MIDYEDSVKQLGEEILDRIGKASGELFLSGNGDPVAGQVTSRTGRLLNSILGGKDSIRINQRTYGGLSLTIGSTLPYAALIAVGGRRIVTNTMRQYFFAQHILTGQPKWLPMALSSELVWQPRPYLQPAVEKVVNTDIPELFAKQLNLMVQTTITEAITGEQKAERL